jgi:hypothetical protein
LQYPTATTAIRPPAVSQLAAHSARRASGLSGLYRFGTRLLAKLPNLQATNRLTATGRVPHGCQLFLSFSAVARDTRSRQQDCGQYRESSAASSSTTHTPSTDLTCASNDHCHAALLSWSQCLGHYQCPPRPRPVYQYSPVKRPIGVVTCKCKCQCN